MNHTPAYPSDAINVRVTENPRQPHSNNGLIVPQLFSNVGYNFALTCILHGGLRQVHDSVTVQHDPDSRVAVLPVGEVKRGGQEFVVEACGDGQLSPVPVDVDTTGHDPPSWRETAMTSFSQSLPLPPHNYNLRNLHN